MPDHGVLADHERLTDFTVGFASRDEAQYFDLALCQAIWVLRAPAAPDGEFLAYPVEAWHDLIADPTVADAILDRLVHKAHTIALKGESMRKGAA